MTIPTTSDFTNYTNRLLTGPDWNNNIATSVNILTTGQYDVDFLTCTAVEFFGDISNCTGAPNIEQSYEVGEAEGIEAGHCVRIDAATQLAYYAYAYDGSILRNTLAGITNVIGMSINSAEQGETIRVKLSGTCVVNTINQPLTPGTKYYVGLLGLLIDDPFGEILGEGSGTGYLMGVAINTTTLLLNRFVGPDFETFGIKVYGGSINMFRTPDSPYNYSIITGDNISEGTSIKIFGFMASNDTLGPLTQSNTIVSLSAQGSDGDQYLECATISIGNNGTSSNNNISGQVIISTRNGVGSLTERMIIKPDGDVTLETGNLLATTNGKGIVFANEDSKITGSAGTISITAVVSGNNINGVLHNPNLSPASNSTNIYNQRYSPTYSSGSAKTGVNVYLNRIDNPTLTNVTLSNAFLFYFTGSVSSSTWLNNIDKTGNSVLGSIPLAIADGAVIGNIPIYANS